MARMNIVAETVKVKSYYPITIMKTRYSGTYEGCNFAAFHCYPEQIPENSHGSDIECLDWWEHFGRWVGKGKTPDEAYENLKNIEEPLTAVWDQERRCWYMDHKPWTETTAIRHHSPDPPPGSAQA